MRRVDLSGFETGQLKVIEKAGTDKNGRTLWRCVCSCGKVCFYRTAVLKSGKVESCGHLQKEKASQLARSAGQMRTFNAGSCLNSFNGSLNSNNTSGVKGVSFYRKSGKWRAQIRYSGKNYYLGLYDSIRDAADAREDAAQFIRDNFENPEKILEYFSAAKK